MKLQDSSWLIYRISVVSFLLVIGNMPVAADELADLKKQVETLAKRIEQLESQQKQVQTVPTVQRVPRVPRVQTEDDLETTTAAVNTLNVDPNSNLITAGDMQGSFKIPDTNTSFKIFGFVRGAFIYDIAARPESRGGDTAGVASAPLEGSQEYEIRGDTRIGARDSKFGISTYTPTDYGDLRTLIEGDFNGPPNDKASRANSNRTAFGVRHAYAEFGNYLVGQTFSNYMDTSAFPEKLDGSGPIARSFIRQGQLRYTWRFDKRSRIAVALENPRGDFVGADDNTLDDSVPDLTANYRYQTDRWHFQYSGMVRRIGIDNGIAGGLKDNAFGWAMQQSAAIYLGDGRDRISWNINFGDGIGRYIEDGGDQGASINLNGNLDTQFGYGGFITYRHWWTETLRSNIEFGIVRFNLNPLAEALFPDREKDANRELYASHVNLIWSPIDKVSFGVEYIHGQRMVHDGREGRIRRLQFNSEYDF